MKAAGVGAFANMPALEVLPQALRIVSLRGMAAQVLPGRVELLSLPCLVPVELAPWLCVMAGEVRAALFER